MKAVTTYAYMQTRVQVRHGARPDKPVWQQVGSQRDLGGYLQLARRTSLRPWVLALHSTDAPHRLEGIILGQLHDYIGQSALWLPRSWHPSVLWVQQLIDIPALQFLLRDETPPAWMGEHPRYRAFAVNDHQQRRQLLQHSPYQTLVECWQRRYPMVAGWLEQWQRLWPSRAPGGRRELQQLAGTIDQHRRDFETLPPFRTWRQREALVEKLEYRFRGYSFHPAALFCHIALISLDCERLRGDVMRRSLFPATESAP